MIVSQDANFTGNIYRPSKTSSLVIYDSFHMKDIVCSML